jgi:SAM-dependent methyltransferase
MLTQMNTQGKLRYQGMRNMIKNSEDKVILDIGAGGNPVSKGVQSKKTIRIDGVEEAKPDICCDFSKKIPLDDESVDIILAGEIIEHMLNPYRFIKECSRVLKVGGQIIISTPNICSIKNRIKVLLGKLPEYCAEPLEEEGYERHVVDFNLERLIRILRKYHLKLTDKDSNGVISHGKLLWPLSLTPPTFGECIIVNAVKIK